VHDYNWQASLTTAAEAGERKMRRLLGDHIGAVTLAVLFLLQILVPLVSANVRNPFTPAYLFSTLTSLFSTLLGYYLFVPNGQNDRLSMPESRATLTAWREESDRVRRAGKLTRFGVYCLEWAEAEANERRERAIEALTLSGVDRTAYETVWRRAGRKARRRARKKGELTREQVKLLARIKPPVVRPLAPNRILEGGGEGRAEVALRGDSRYLRRAMAGKPVICVLSVLLQSFFYPDLRQNADPVAILCGVAVRVFCVCCAALSGYRTGAKGAACHLDDVRCRTIFLAEFNEKEEAKTPDNGA